MCVLWLSWRQPISTCCQSTHPTSKKVKFSQPSVKLLSCNSSIFETSMLFKKGTFYWWDSNFVVFPGELYSRVSGQHLSSGLLCPETAETEPPDQLQFPKGQEGRPVARQAFKRSVGWSDGPSDVRSDGQSDGRSDRQTPEHQWCSFPDNIQAKLSEGWAVDGAWTWLPPSGGTLEQQQTYFFSIIKENKAIQLFESYSSSHDCSFLELCCHLTFPVYARGLSFHQHKGRLLTIISKICDQDHVSSW